ncbi:STAS domain-containing protein [Kitasatospora sp. NPDC001664]
MTSSPLTPLRLTTVDAGHVLRMELHGDLDHDSADLLLDQVTARLAERPALEHLHLRCAGLDTVDSTGLSVLLMIRRRTDTASVQLHLDDRPARLERLLRVTGTLDHLTAVSPVGDGGRVGPAAGRPGSGG